MNLVYRSEKHGSQLISMGNLEMLREKGKRRRVNFHLILFGNLEQYCVLSAL